MWFSVYVVCGCYVWIAMLVQQMVQPQECGLRSKYNEESEYYQNWKVEAHPNSWPWHVGVYSSAIGPYPYCGGTLIAPKWVLTAAHCIFSALQCKLAPYGQLFSYYDVTGEVMVVSVAEHNYTQLQRPTYNVRVKGVIIHPFATHDISNAGFDIALLQLNRTVKRTSVAEYACLPERGLILPDGFRCKFAGWGKIPNPPYQQHPDYPEALMEVGIQIVPTSLCKINVPYVDDYDTICTDEAQGALCNGDSGGGLHCLTPDRSEWVVYGVYSSGSTYCMDGFGVFALTTKKLSWINTVITVHA